ncbi:hypothetical protein [Actinomadura madurae]|uniref:hypothetical protein n=1 Tax=Actinomadura madurae TaxID=1993 RepID=UPI0020D2476B|nr:hypothetical protein [Actinomadura madurae]MCP9978228.1 hypothetical protein [Actinomadura madurae]
MAALDWAAGYAVRHRLPMDLVHAHRWAFEEAASRGVGILALHAVGGDLGSPRRRVIEDMELSESLAGLREHQPDVQVEELVSDLRHASRPVVVMPVDG